MTLEQELESGLSHHQAGRLAEAEKVYRQVLSRQPNHADALHMLGVLAAQMGQPDAAEDLIRQAIRIKPDYAEAYNNLGFVLTSKGRPEEAAVSLRQAIRINPDLADAHYNLGIALELQDQLDEAIGCFRQVIRIKPDFAKAYNNLGIALQRTGELEEAIASFRSAVKLKPDDAGGHNNLGIALFNRRQFDKAVACYQQAIVLKPDYATAHSNLGSVLKSMGQLDRAIASFKQSIQLEPDLAEAHNNLGNAYKDTGQLDEAEGAYRSAIRLEPDFAQAHSNLIYALQFHHRSETGMIHEELRRWNQQHAEPLRKFVRPHTNNRHPNRRLRIGYVSADFLSHSVSQFLLPLFQQHDHGAYAIICYSDVSTPDAVTVRLRACVDGWQNIAGWTDQRVADKVREDKIDILVDLSGHTSGNRLRVFARKPAPVEVSYLGYPGSTGLSEMDYRLTDFGADPPGKTESLCSEKLLRLPVYNWCYGEPEGAPQVGPLPAETSGSICFGTFNHIAKASPVALDLWVAILISMPSSRLIIKSRGLGEKSIHCRIQEYFASRGVQAERLEMLGHQPDVMSHLETYSKMDIALDTFPYHGTTTTCEATWMGVPVVTLAGSSHISRVGVSLLTSVGLPELIAQSNEEYVSIAVGLAKDLSRLAELRRTLRQRMRLSALMDAPRFARDIEAAYRQIWREWCARSSS